MSTRIKKDKRIATATSLAVEALITKLGWLPQPIENMSLIELRYYRKILEDNLNAKN